MPLFLLPFLPWLFVIIPIGIGLLAFGTNLWVQLVEWKTAAIFIGAIVGVAIVSMTDSPWAKFAITAILCFACYLQGNVDGVTRTNAKWNTLKAAEEQRQSEVNQAAQEEARQRLEELEKLSSKLSTQEKKANEEAIRSPNAASPAFDIDSIERLNRMRR